MGVNIASIWGFSIETELGQVISKLKEPSPEYSRTSILVETVLLGIIVTEELPSPIAIPSEFNPKTVIVQLPLYKFGIITSSPLLSRVENSFPPGPSPLISYDLTSILISGTSVLETPESKLIFRIPVCSSESEHPKIKKTNITRNKQKIKFLYFTPPLLKYFPLFYV